MHARIMKNSVVEKGNCLGPFCFVFGFGCCGLVCGWVAMRGGGERMGPRGAL